MKGAVTQADFAFVGQAFAVLAPYADLRHVYLQAPFEQRVQRVLAREGVPDLAAAEERVPEADQEAACTAPARPNQGQTMSVAQSTTRYRVVVTLLACLVLVLGLLSRRSLPFVPGLIQAYSGDVLWALLVYLLVRWLRPTQPVLLSGIYAGMFALGIELSQLYHAPWLDAIRQTPVGGLILGFGFLWSDLVCYTCGIAIGCVGESSLRYVRTLREHQAPTAG